MLPDSHGRGSPATGGLESFCTERRLDLEYLTTVWGVKECVFSGRPALRYTTPTGIDRIKFLDGETPKYRWAGSGGTKHWYGIKTSIRLGGPLYLVNGEPSVWAAQQRGIAAVCLCAGEGAVPSRALIKQLKEAGFNAIRIVYDLDQAGEKGAQQVAEALRTGGIGVEIRKLPDSLDESADVDDFHRQVGRRLADELGDLPVSEPTRALQSQLDEVESMLSELGEDQSGQELASALRTVDQLVKSADSIEKEIVRERVINRLSEIGIRSPARMADAVLKTATNGGPEELSGVPEMLQPPEPWDEEVDGLELIKELEETIRRFVVIPEPYPLVIGLWILHAHSLDSGLISPNLALQSPVKRCGKTTLLQLLSTLVPKPLPASNITPAAIFRAVDMYGPTLLIDEADTFLKLNPELRGILNSSHNRLTAYVVRCVGENHVVETFSTWCPIVIAMIGKLPSTLEDRSIVVSMKRRTSGEVVDKFRPEFINAFEDLRRKAARWAVDMFDTLLVSKPEMPEGLNDRAEDNWRPLTSISDAIGGEVSVRVRQAAQQVEGKRKEEDDSSNVELLRDIWNMFGAEGSGRLFTRDIVTDLVEDEERPWGEWKKGKPITERQIAQILKPFGIRPGEFRIGKEKGRGYERSDFMDPAKRYLQDELRQPGHASFQKSSPQSESATIAPVVAGDGLGNHKKTNGVADVSAQRGGAKMVRERI